MWLAPALLLLLARGAGAAPVVLISVDGMLPAYYLEPDRLGLSVPTLRALVREGAFALGATSVMPSVTFPAHTTMITGVSPNRHGIRTNAIFDPDGSLGGGWHFYYDDIQVPTLFGKAREAGLRTAAVTWPVTAGAPVDMNLPDMYPTPTLREAKNLVALARTGMQGSVFADLLPAPEALIHLKDDVRTKVAVRFVREKPDFLAVHFLELDEAQHTFGPRSTEALATVERLDGALAAVFAELRAAGRWEETTVVLVSDHGFLPVKFEVRLGVLLRTLGLSQVDAQGKLVSWRALSTASGGTAAIYLHPQATGDDRRKVDDAVRLLLGNPAYGISRAFRGAELGATGGFAGAYVVLEAAPGYMLVRGPDTGEVVAPSTNFAGTHGFDPRRPEMRAAFVMRGPRVRAGKSLGLVRLLDVAPTIARILGVELGKTEGKVLGEAFEATASTRVAAPSRPAPAAPAR
jgi:predicted AlkP superfamily pyrophosphatase or phosphodiesterase